MVHTSEKLDSRFLLAFAMAHETLKSGLARVSELNTTQYRILMMVYQARPESTPQASISEVLHLQPNVVAQGTSVLEGRTYIVRKKDASDARAKNLSITGAGKRHIDAVNAALVEELYASWPTEDPAFRSILETTIMAGGQIATDIPQTNPDYFPASHVLTITERSTRLIEEAVEEQLQISILEARVLQRLAEVAEPLRMHSLSQQLQLSGATTTRTVNQLVKQEYVQRLASPSDNKAVYVALTQQGQEFAAQVQHTIDRAGSKHFWGPMNDAQRKAFRLMGEVVIDDMRKRREAKRKSELDQLIPA